MTVKVRDLFIVVSPEGNGYYNDEKEAIAAFREDTKAIRIVKQTEALLRTGFKEDAFNLYGVPKEVWTNRGHQWENTLLVVERVDGRENWPANEMHPSAGRTTL